MLWLGERGERGRGGEGGGDDGDGEKKCWLHKDSQDSGSPLRDVGCARHGAMGGARDQGHQGEEQVQCGMGGPEGRGRGCVGDNTAAAEFRCNGCLRLRRCSSHGLCIAQGGPSPSTQSYLRSIRACATGDGSLRRAEGRRTRALRRQHQNAFRWGCDGLVGEPALELGLRCGCAAA